MKSPEVNQDIWKKIQDMERLVAKAKTEDNSDLTAVIGGLSGSGEQYDAEKWVTDTLWHGWASMPTKMYFRQYSLR